MLKIARKHPILCACAVVAVVAVASFSAMAFYANELAIFAFFPFATACFVAIVVMNYQVFGGNPNSSIYRPGAKPDDDPR